MATHGCTSIPCSICGSSSNPRDDRDAVFVEPATATELELQQKVDQLTRDLLDARLAALAADSDARMLESAARTSAGTNVRALEEIQHLEELTKEAIAWREEVNDLIEDCRRFGRGPYAKSTVKLASAIDLHIARIASRS